MSEGIKIVILAAGKGGRMGGEGPKVLAEVKGKPMIEHLRNTISGIHDEKPIAVVGHGAELVKEKFGDSFVYVIQAEQLGTAHALLAAKEQMADADHVVVLYGDQPFIRGETIKKLLGIHLESGAKITFATATVPNFESHFKALYTFARIIRKGGTMQTREFKDTDEKEKEIKEINAGCYVFDTKWLWENLEKIENNNAQGEYYLTDLLKIASEGGMKVESVEIDPKEALGANSREDLEILENLGT